jgi:ATP-binding cassette subfamily B protein
MATTHVWLAVVAVTPLPFVYLTGKRMRDGMFPVSWIISSRQADVATIVEENVTGTRVVKSFAQEGAQLNVLARAAQRLRWAGVLQVDIRAKWAPFMQNLPRLGLAAVLLYGGKLVIDGAVTIGTVIEFNAYVVMLQAPFMMLGFLMMMGQRAAASAGRIFEILDEPDDIVDRPGSIDLVDSAGEVWFDHVTFAYADGPTVLDDFALHLAPGETVALVGRTGSGKSTVARLLPRFYDVQEGAVVIDGHDVRDLTLDSLRADIGLVLDEPFLFSETIRNNIAYGRPGASEADVLAAATAAGVMEFVDKLPAGFETLVGERGYTLSGGQRQRIAIARTLLVNPRILILDDATSAIDVQVEHEIHGALRTLMEGRTTLIIAHRLSTISLADRVVLLRDGQVFADGTHADLMATVPEYAEVLARAEEEWQEAHAPKPDPEEELPPRVRAMKRVMEARIERDPDGIPSPGGVPGIGGAS